MIHPVQLSLLHEISERDNVGFYNNEVYSPVIDANKDMTYVCYPANGNWENPFCKIKPNVRSWSP